MNNYEIYVGGHFKTTGEELPVMNPYNGEVVAITYQASEKEYEEAVTAAQAVRKEMEVLASFKRYEILMHISRRLTEKNEEIARVLAAESGKPMLYARGEIARAAQTFLVAAEESKRLPSEMMSLDWTPAGAHKEGYVKYFPAGLVAGIAPFNFPMNLAVHKIAPAIAAGAPIVLKPASSTPLSTLELAKIIDETDLPKGAVSILPMDRTTGNKLVTDDRFAVLSFTGSPWVGWKMKADAGKKKVVLELGGNAGVIVTESADLDRAVERSLMGAFAYSGQVCIHAQRIIIHQSVYDEFMEKFLAGVAGLTSGDPLDDGTQFSSMIDENNAKRIEEWVQEAVDGGAELLVGGKRQGTYVEPTVLTNVKPEMKVCAEEAFGPVLVVEKYSEFSEALSYINDSVFGLQAGVFTKNVDEQYEAWNELHVGGVVINDVPTFRVDHMPYGGVKESGLGREGLKYAILDMMEPRIMVVDRR